MLGTLVPLLQVWRWCPEHWCSLWCLGGIFLVAGARGSPQPGWFWSSETCGPGSGAQAGLAASGVPGALCWALASVLGITHLRSKISHDMKAGRKKKKRKRETLFTLIKNNLRQCIFFQSKQSRSPSLLIWEAERELNKNLTCDREMTSLPHGNRAAGARQLGQGSGQGRGRGETGGRCGRAPALGMK